MPKGAFIKQSIQIGVNALPIVGLIALLMGLIMGFQAAYQLQQFGASIFVADLVGLAMLRELASLMTGIVIAGRSGSAIAAELGTMRVNEEIDALEVMSISPLRFLVAPRVFAIVLTQPALTLMAMLIGIFGGAMIALFYLQLSPAAYFSQLLQVVGALDMGQGLLKSIVFALLIVMISTYTGLHGKRGAASVGKSTTSAVVSSIFAIIVFDSIITTVATIAFDR